MTPLWWRLASEPKRWRHLQDGGMALNDAAWAWSQASVCDALAFHAPQASFSGKFIEQLVWATLRCEERFGRFRMLIDAHAIFDALSDIEKGTKRTLTEPGRPFKGNDDILAGLWHKHFFTAQFMVKNLLNESDRYLTKAIYRDLPRITGHSLAQGMPAGTWIDPLVHLAVIGSYEHRAARRGMTGEWIIYRQLNDKHREYLLIATHAQAQHHRKELKKRLEDAKSQILLPKDWQQLTSESAF